MNAHRLAASLFLSAGATTASAGEDCTTPMANWQPREAIMSMAANEGWTLRRITTDDGCYEIFGMDADGRNFYLTLDPGTLALIELEYLRASGHDDDDDDGGYDDDDGDDGGNGGERPAAAGIVPPDNGLFSPGAAAPAQGN